MKRSDNVFHIHIYDQTYFSTKILQNYKKFESIRYLNKSKLSG